MLARSIMVATRLGIFEALRERPCASAEVARACQLDERATEKLLNALTGSGYLEVSNDIFSLAGKARQWLLKGTKNSFRDKVLFQFLEWDWWGQCEDYIRSGKPITIHENMSSADWALYQRGMRSCKDAAAHELAKRLSVPTNPRTLLDIGGSHGTYSAALCREHPRLTSTILELPPAIEHAAPILAAHGLGERLQHRPGDALTDELGENAYDIVFIASLVHHFSAEQNQALITRAGRALRPGGTLAILEALRSEASHTTQFGGLLDLYFSMTSQSGTWSAADMAEWQRRAGLKIMRTIRLRNAPNVAVISARKPA
jgi:ubiquinone/menaquinone biosynthesis C-methylase UbiE